MSIQVPTSYQLKSKWFSYRYLFCLIVFRNQNKHYNYKKGVCVYIVNNYDSDLFEVTIIIIRQL